MQDIWEDSVLEDMGIDEVDEGGEKMHLQSDELEDMHSSPSDRIKKSAIVWTRSTYGEMSSYHEAMIWKNSMALVRERTIPTERPPPVGEVSANFCG